MCRWLAYTGSRILLKNALISPAHSLIDQSLHARMGAEPTNGDGYGVGWYDDQPEPGVFRSVEPAWNDQNLREVAGHITSGHFLGHIRAAIGSAVQQTNCHPFRHGRWLFMHNGYIGDFAVVKRDLVLAVDESLYPAIAGQADTEVLFYLGLEDDPPQAVSRAIGWSSTSAAARASSAPSRARSPQPTVSGCGPSATRAREGRGRCSTRRTSPRSASSTRSATSSRNSPTTPGSSCPSRSATFPGAWIEVPEASYVVVGEEGDPVHPFTVAAPLAGSTP